MCTRGENFIRIGIPVLFATVKSTIDTSNSSNTVLLFLRYNNYGSIYHDLYQGRIQDFKLGGGGGGAHIKKLRRAEGDAKIFGVFRVKNHDFTPKNHIFSNFRGGGEPRAGCAPPLNSPLYTTSGQVHLLPASWP